MRVIKDAQGVTVAGGGRTIDCRAQVAHHGIEICQDCRSGNRASQPSFRVFRVVCKGLEQCRSSCGAVIASRAVLQDPHGGEGVRLQCYKYVELVVRRPKPLERYLRTF